MKDSKAATKINEKRYLLKLLKNNQIITALKYRGSLHGWYSKDFHSQCDFKGPKICLFKIKDGDCIGGYTTVKWTSEFKLISDSDSMLFNLSSSRHFPSKKLG